MDTQKRFIVWFSVVLVVGITTVAAWQIATGKSPEPRHAGFLTEAVGPADHTKGATTTPSVSLVEYSDFQCPACGAYYPLVEKIFSENKDKIAFTYRHFPLSQHKNALAASYASEAAAKQGKFWEMHAKLFETQNDWGETDTAVQTFEGYAKDLGLNLAQFRTDRDSATTKDIVAHDRDTGIAAGINATPTFYLNGKKMQNPQSYEEFKSIIEDAIKNS